MSDIFDHMFEAYTCEREPDECGSGYFKADRNYYHTEINVVLKGETEKAFLVEYKNSGISLDLWLPKKICRKSSRGDDYLWVHTEIFMKIFREKTK